MAKVSLQNVTKIYSGNQPGTVNAVSDVSFEAADGEFVVVAGPRGCGKSTVLRMIAGLEATSRGDILFADRRMNEVPPKDRDVAMVFEEDALYPQMSVQDNIAFGLKLRNFAPAEIKKRIREAAEILTLAEVLDRTPESLSAAQRQRVAVARAIVRQPKVVLLDEPLARLDGEARVQMRAALTRLHQRLEATIICAARDAAEALALAHRIVVMNKGAVQQNDTPSAVYDSPANLVVARYFGSPGMNLLEGALKQDRDALLFNEINDGTVQVRLPASERLRAADFVGKPVLLGIRPEDIAIAPVTKGQQNAGASFPAIVDMVEPSGAETRLYLHTGAHDVVCRTQHTLDRHEAGHRMHFALNAAKAHLFDPVTTLRIV